MKRKYEGHRGQRSISLCNVIGQTGTISICLKLSKLWSSQLFNQNEAAMELQNGPVSFINKNEISW